jgi:imidazolonepropionase-like amidohydrolase
MFPAVALAEAPGVYAITNATVHPVSGAQISNGTVVVREGLIEAVGTNLNVPPDATVIDARGGHVYPGFIDAFTTFGIAEARRSGSAGSTPPAAARQEINAASLALDSLNFSEEDVDSKRRTGVTTIVVAPSSSIFNGQSVVLNLGSGPTASRVIRNRAALNLAFNTRPRGVYPGSLMGVVAYIRQTFLDAQQHTAARAVYDRAPAGQQRPANDAALEAVGPALRREMPIVFAADTESAIRRAQAIAREFNLRLVVAGGRQAYKVAGDLRDVPVLVSVKWPAAPESDDDRTEQPLRVIRDRVLSPTTPSALAKSGVTFALVSGPGRAADFVPGIRRAMENGLTADDALRAVTLTPARIFGIDRQLGSLERGKIANIVVSDGPVFSKGSKITRLIVDGREVRLSEDEKKSDATSPVAPGDGTWSLTVRTPQGDVSIVATLRVESGRVTGSFSGDRGSGDIRSGTFDGTTLEFTISAEVDAETADWAFRGTVRENNVEGTVATTSGTFQFSGSKPR